MRIMKSENKSQQSLFELPPWMPEEPWREFLKMRAKKRNAPTDYAKMLLIARLDRLRLAGHDPRTMIHDSIEHGWLTFYEPNGKANGNGKAKGSFAQLFGTDETASR